MNRNLRLFFIVATAGIVVSSTGVLLSSRANARKRASEAQAALRKGVRFLKPDTKSDIRFGKGKVPATPPPPTPPKTSR